MAEAAVLGVANSVLQKLGSLAFDEFLLVWTLDKDLKSLERTIQTITDFLLDAEERVSKDDHLMKGWVSRLRAVLYDADDLFDALAARALRKKVMSGSSFRKEVRRFFSKSNQLAFVVKTAHDVKDIKERLDFISKDMSQFNFIIKRSEENPTRAPIRKETHSFVKIEEVIGRDREKEELIELLLPKEENHQLSLSVITVIGFGGLGKTTLAQFVYNDVRVKSGFDLCLWACVNYFSDLKEALVAILTAVLGFKPNDNSLDNLQRQLREKIEGKKYFLVLDDVWDENPSNWDDLKKILDCGKIGSKILATTRSTEVAQCLNAVKPYYLLKILSEESAWDLFAKSTFEEGEILNDSELVRLGKKIVQKCGYAPLALITIGCMLRSKEKDKKRWLSVVDSELAYVIADNKDDRIMTVLMFSYICLPSPIKDCFAYCSIFPKDYRFEKDVLVRMWAAHGFIKGDPKQSLEEVGDAYFFHMVDRCFFQEVRMDTWLGYPRYTCKMHDLLHDLALQVAGDESRCFIGEDKSMSGKSSLRHVFVKSDRNVVFEPYVLSPHSKMLRTLLFDGVCMPFKTTSSLNSLLGCFKMLRALQMAWFLDIDMLPDSFGQLIHLRYLDLSYNRKLKKIPNSICELQYLQTLDLNNCSSLVELPLNLGKLVSLRHLCLENCESLGSLPSGLAKITTLVSLDRVIVHPSNGGLRYLGCLDDLRGTVRIELPNGWPDCIEDARKSNMSKKHKLHGMMIKYLNGGGEGGMTKKEAEAVLEAVQPHENLEYLSIHGYVGDKLPSWVFSHSNLKEVSLYHCALEYLSGVPMDSIKFLTSLKCLKIISCDIRWVSTARLAYLTALEQLEIWWYGNVKLEDIYEEEAEKEEIKNQSGMGMPWKALQRLRRLNVPWQRHLQGGIQYLTALEDLMIQYYESRQVEEDNEMVENGPHLQGGLQYLTALQELACDIGWYSGFPKWIQHLRCLKELRLIKSHELSLSWAMLAKMKLQRLSFYYVEKVVSVDETEPEQQIQFNSLIQLKIGNTEEDAGWIHDIPWNIFPSLRTIELNHVKKLKKIPDGFKHLTSLQNLTISGDDSYLEFKERCKPETGEDWHLISHIPTIHINR